MLFFFSFFSVLCHNPKKPKRTRDRMVMVMVMLMLLIGDVDVVGDW